MAVTRAGVGYQQPFIGGATTGTKTVTFNVAAGLENAYGIVAVGIVAGASVASAALSVEWNGDAMTEMLDDPLLFANPVLGSNTGYLMGWIIDDPDPGVTEVEITYASLPGNILQNMFISCVALANMEALDLPNIADAVVTAVGSGSVTTSGVTVSSRVPADRVISVHQIGVLNSFTGFTGTKVTAPLSIGGGHQILGETRGAPSVTPTVTHALASSSWAAFGLHTDAAPLEDFGIWGSVSVPRPTFGADLYRFAKPHFDRDYMVPAIHSSDENEFPRDAIITANGVELPIYIKDPDDTLDYTFRWNNHLADDDEIIAVEHTASGSLRVISEAIDPENKAMTQVWVKGATRGVSHPVRIRFWTARGRQHDFTFYIAAENN